jgi:hypothetical protein
MRIQCRLGKCGVCGKEEQLLLYERVCGRCLMEWKANRAGARAGLEPGAPQIGWRSTRQSSAERKPGRAPGPRC